MKAFFLVASSAPPQKIMKMYPLPTLPSTLVPRNTACFGRTVATVLADRNRLSSLPSGSIHRLAAILKHREGPGSNRAHLAASRTPSRSRNHGSRQPPTRYIPNPRPCPRAVGNRVRERPQYRRSWRKTTSGKDPLSIPQPPSSGQRTRSNPILGIRNGLSAYSRHGSAVHGFSSFR